jgi:cobalt-zinc-cadmium efflux system membrane fusion protein
VTIKRSDFDRTISVPAMVIERPGRTQIEVSAPMTGIVMRIYPLRGEAVAPGEPLFDLRLMHEDLVQAQSTFLRTLEQLDVIKREDARLEDVTASGAIAGKRLLERQYEQQQTEAQLRAQRQALMLHGLTEKQVDGISASRRLLQDVTIVAPQPTGCQSCRGHEEYLQVAELAVLSGEYVATGGRLCMFSTS